MIGVWILIGIVALIVGGILAWNLWDEDVGLILMGFGGMFLFIFCITFPICRAEERSKIIEYNATKTSIEAARSNGESIENYAMQQKIIDINNWLATAQYWNGKADMFYPDEIEALVPLK